MTMLKELLHLHVSGEAIIPSIFCWITYSNTVLIQFKCGRSVVGISTSSGTKVLMRASKSTTGVSRIVSHCASSGS